MQERSIFQALGALVAVVLILLAPAARAAGEQRYALLIGNADYEDAEPLENPRNDIDLVGEALERADFDVTRVSDLDQLGMLSALNNFTRLAEKAENPLLLVYYSGYAVQIDGENHLLPVDASGRTRTGLRSRSLPVSQVAEALRPIGTGLKVVLLDAAHENPFLMLRDIEDGLARPKDGDGLHYAYAAAPGTVGDDDGTPVSPYASAFADAVSIPSAALEEVFRRVHDIVRERSGGRQETWESDGDYGRLALGKTDAAVDAAEVSFYEFAALADNREGYERYLARYPQGIFATIAERKIALLGRRLDRAQEDNGRISYLAFSNDGHDPCGRLSFDGEDRHLSDRYKDGQLVLLDFRFRFPPERCDDLSYFSTVYAHERLRNVITAASIPERRIYVGSEDDLSPSEERAIYAYFDGNRRGYAQSLMFRAIDEERRHGLAVAVRTPDDSAREYVEEVDCGKGCLGFRGLVRFRDRSGRSGEDDEFEFVDVRRLGLYDRYRDALDDVPVRETELARHEAGDGYGAAADPYRTVRTVGGWEIVADFSGDRRFANCRARRGEGGGRHASFRWYPDGHLTFGFEDTSYDYGGDHAVDGRYRIDDGRAYDVRGTAYGRQEVAYDLGSDRAVFEALRRGSRLRLGEVAVSLKGSSAMLGELQACVAAFR